MDRKCFQNLILSNSLYFSTLEKHFPYEVQHKIQTKGGQYNKLQAANTLA